MKKISLLTTSLITSLTFGQELHYSFETSEDFELGNISGQNGWTVTTNSNTNEPIQNQVITNEEASMGENALHLTYEPSLGYQPIPIVGAFKTLDTPLNKNSFTLSYDLKIIGASNANRSTFQTSLGNNEEGYFVLGLMFFYDSRILFQNNDGSGNGLDIVEVGNWEGDTWYNVKIEGNEDSAKFFLNDELLAEGALGYDMDELRFAQNNYGSGGLYIDNVSILYSTLSTNETSLHKNISISPNPATDIVNIQSESPIKNLTVFNSLGELVMEEHPSANKKQTSTNISRLPKGTFFLQLETTEGRKTKKLIKK